MATIRLLLDVEKVRITWVVCHLRDVSNLCCADMWTSAVDQFYRCGHYEETGYIDRKYNKDPKYILCDEKEGLDSDKCPESKKATKSNEK